MKTPFWEETYKDDNIFTFGTTPNATIIEFEHLFRKGGYALDIGCGDGKNSLYLAQLGFAAVDAFDLSQNGIDRLMQLAGTQGVSVNAWAEDLRQFTFAKTYDVVISFGTLHFVEREAWRKLLMDAKENTNAGGIHIIQLFTNMLPASPDIADFAIGLADDKEIEKIYRDWDILQLKSYSFEDEHPVVPKHFHASNKIVARKK